MSSRQRVVLGVLCGLIAVLLVAVAVVSVARDAEDGIDDGETAGARLEVAGEAEQRTPESTDTTFALVPVTGGAALPTTTAPPPPKPPPPSVVATGPAAGGAAPAPAPGAATKIRSVPTIGADGRILQAAAEGSPTRTVDKAKGCNSANDAGWKVVQCGALKRDDVVLIWVVESKGASLRAIVLRERTAGQWALVLEATDPEGDDWSKIGVRGEDVSGDGRPDLVFGFRAKAGDKGMDVDLVEAGAVTMHVRLPGPSVSVVLKPGELHTWSTSGGGADHSTVKWSDGAWEVVATEHVARSSVPPSMV